MRYKIIKGAKGYWEVCNQFNQFWVFSSRSEAREVVKLTKMSYKLADMMSNTIKYILP